MIKLSESEEYNTLHILQHKFLNYFYILYALDPVDAEHFERRNEYYFEKNNGRTTNYEKDEESGSKQCSSGHSHKHSSFYIPENELTFKEKHLYEMTKSYKLVKDFPNLLKYLSDRFFSIKQKNATNLSEWTEEVEQYILKEVLKEGLKHYYVNKLKRALASEGKKDSTSHLLIANPQQWFNMFPEFGPLNSLSQENMCELFTKDKKIVPFKHWEGQNDLIRKARNELKFLERDGKFEAKINNLKLDEERALFVLFSELNKEHHSGLYTTCQVLTSFPFELNSKASYGFQISEGLKYICLGPKQKQDMHRDGTDSSENDNGIA